MISRRHFLQQLSNITALSLLQTCSRNQVRIKEKPNIILILADDLGYNDLSCYGNREIRTPNIDKIAAQGVRFTSFYANAPECTPTRTALLTGRYQQRVGGLECALGIGNVGRYDDAIRLRQSDDLGLPVEEISLARMLKSVGYNTAMCGKWHLGYEPKFSPNDHGFDYAYYILGGSVDYFHHKEHPPIDLHSLHRNKKPIHDKGYITDRFTDEAINYIDQQSNDVPFFLYMPYNAPHSPYQGPEDFKPEILPRNSPLWRQRNGPKAVYKAMIERMDACIGRMLHKLEQKKFADNTLIVFMSDNGASRSGDNSPLNKNKGTLFEGGIRVPCTVMWPSTIPGGNLSDQPCISMDFTSSIAQIAGYIPPDSRKFDGIDILGHIVKNRPLMSRTLYWRARRGNRTQKAVRDGFSKYINDNRGDQVQEYLFDLKNDLSEQKNLLKERPDEVNRLKLLLKEWEKEVQHKR